MTQEKEIGKRFADLALADDGKADDSYVRELMKQIYLECMNRNLNEQKAYGHFFLEMALWLVPPSER